MDRTPTQSPKSLGRRLVTAGAAALLVLGVLLTAVATASSEAGEFTFATARAGDRWSYSLEAGEGWSFGPNDTMRQGVAVPAFDFGWTAPVPVRLADGELHAAARLDLVGIVYDPPAFPGSFSDDGRHWSERGGYVRSAWAGEGGRLLAVEVGGGWGTAGGGTEINPFGLVPVLEQDRGFSIRSLVTEYQPESGLCLADLVRPGTTVALDGPIRLTGTCHLGGVLNLDGDVRFRPGPVETVVGVQALRFDAVGADVQMWYSPSIPYPVQVVASGQGKFTGQDGEVVLRMTGFTAGTHPIPVPDELADRDPVPALALRAPQPWGPDDSEAGFEFPLSEAFARARDDPEYADLRQFLGKHTGVFATGASLTIEDQVVAAGPVNRTHGNALRWAVALASDAGDCFSFSSTRQVRETGTVPQVGTLPLPPLVDAPSETTYIFDTSTSHCLRPDDAPAPTAPTSWPTVSSALAQWEKFANAEELEQGPTGWSFALLYDDDAWRQVLAVGQVAGRALYTEDLTGGTSYTYVGRGVSGGLVYVDGAITEYDRVTTRFHDEQRVAGLSPSGFVRGEGGDGTVVDDRETGLGDLDPVDVRSLGLAAAVAGLGMLAWSAVKAGPLGLFSRLQAPDLLDHPVRKELVQRIEAQPGVHYQDLVRAMGKGKGAIEHHLRKLQEGGLVKSVSAAGYTCFFPAAFDRRLTAAAPALKSEGARRVLAAIRGHPGASAMQVAAVTGLSPAAINHHLRRLGAAGLVDVLRNGRSLSLQPTALASQVAGNEAAAGA